MFILGHGEVQVMSGETVITTLKDGQFFGEMALLEDSVRSADVVAASYCDLYIFEREDFEQLNEKFPELRQRFENIGRRRKTDAIAKESQKAA